MFSQHNTIAGAKTQKNRLNFNQVFSLNLILKFFQTQQTLKQTKLKENFQTYQLNLTLFDD